MTTRPTDEQLRSMSELVADRALSATDIRNRAADMLLAWLAERQAARDRVTDEMVEIARNRLAEVCGLYIAHEYMRAALQSIAPPITSISDALNFLEEWALAGNQLHDDDIQEFRATVKRIAPIALPVRVPDDVEPEAWMIKQDGLNPLNAAYEVLADAQIRCEHENRHGGKFKPYPVYDSPQPQQSVPDDKRRMDWIEEQVSEGVLNLAFDMDGGVFVDIHSVSGQSAAFHGNDVREVIDKIKNGDQGSNQVKRSPLMMMDEIMGKLSLLTIGCCTCFTKTPNINYHDKDCSYRLAFEIRTMLNDMTCAPSHNGKKEG